LHAGGEIRDFLEVLISTPLIVALCILLEYACPHLLFVIPPLWVFSILLDVYTTWRFYRLEPERFMENERNAIYARLVGRFGFKAGSVLQFVLVEVPFLLIFSFLPIPVLYLFLRGRRPSSAFSLSTGMTLFLAAHLQAARLNIGFERKITPKMGVNK
jgi:hypothetical protein